MNIEALTHYLVPLNPWLNNPEVSDIYINKPQELWVTTGLYKNREIVPELTYHILTGLCTLIANYSSQRLSEKEPLLSASLPCGARIQIVLAPVAATSGTESISIAIRKKVLRNLSLSDLMRQGLFDVAKPRHLNIEPRMLNDEETEISALFVAGDYFNFLKQCIHRQKNILFSGATGSGKTTLLNACLQDIPHHERIITLEDVREVCIPHADQSNLLASKNNQGVNSVTMEQLVQVCLRLSPDRIILGEIRGDEAWDFVQAASTGHDGTMASIHASNPQMALLRLASMVQSNPKAQLSRNDILTELHSLIDVVVQMKEIRTETGKRRVISEIYSAFNPASNTVHDNRMLNKSRHTISHLPSQVSEMSC